MLLNVAAEKCLHVRVYIFLSVHLGLRGFLRNRINVFVKIHIRDYIFIISTCVWYILKQNAYLKFTKLLYVFLVSFPSHYRVIDEAILAETTKSWNPLSYGCF